MKLTIWTGAMLAIMLLAAHSGAVETGIIKGRVFDTATGTPIAGAAVLVDGTRLKAVTGLDGSYTILNVPAGAYIVRIEKAGARSMLQRVTIAAGQTMTVDFGTALAQVQPSKMKDAKRQDNAAIGKVEESASTDAELHFQGVRADRLRSAEGALSMRMNDCVVAPPSCMTPPVGWTPAGSEEYNHIRENDWLSTQDKQLSTLSVDVDAASYSNMRRFITSGQLPPPDAVRIEEMINYFDYDYPNPRGPHPFSITTEVAACPWNPEHKLVHIGLQGKRLDVEELPPSNLVFLIDVSGSMNSPDKLPLLKSSFRLLVEQLREEDCVAIVVYAGAAGLVLPSTSGADKDEILRAIDRLEAGGSTAGAAGIQLAYQVAQQNFRRGANNRVILATDGDFNVGTSSDAEMIRLIEDKRKSGVFLTVLGFGEGNLKDSKMEKIADHGNGHYAYIDNLTEGHKVFVNEMGATLLTIAKDVKLQVEFNPARVASYRLVGYENRVLQDRDFDDDTKDAGEIGAGHSVTALYEIELVGRGDAAHKQRKYSKTTVKDGAHKTSELLTVSFRYKQPTEKESRLLTVAVKDRNPRYADTSDNFRFSAAVAEFGMILRDSSQKGNASMDHVIKTARASLGEDPHGYRAEFVVLAETAESLMTPAVGWR